MAKPVVTAHKPDRTVTYEQLALLNQHCLGAATALSELASQGAIRPAEARYYGVILEETRSLMSQPIVEYLNDREVESARIMSKRRARVEKAVL